MGHRRGRGSRGKKLILAVTTIAVVVALLAVTTPSARQGRAVIILDTLPNTGESFTDECRAILEPAGLRVEAYTGREVTVERIRSLANTPLVILRAHSSVFDDGVWFYTGEPYSNTQHVLEQLANELHIGRTSPTANLTFAVGSRYILNNLHGKLGGALVILMGCDGLRRDDLAKAFADSGAAAFVSWDGPVSVDQTDAATLRLLESLVGGRTTLQEALEGAGQVAVGIGFNSTMVSYPEGAAFTLPTG